MLRQVIADTEKEVVDAEAVVELAKRNVVAVKRKLRMLIKTQADLNVALGVEDVAEQEVASADEEITVSE